MDRPAPTPDPLAAPFWSLDPPGRLYMQRCTHCGEYQHPPVPMCRTCGGALAWVTMSGHGWVASWTENQHAWVPGQLPYLIGIVELSEQSDLRITGNLIDVAPEDVHVGLEVEAVFLEHAGHQYTLFRPGDGTTP